MSAQVLLVSPSFYSLFSLFSSLLAISQLLLLLPSAAHCAETLFEGGTVLSFDDVTESVKVLFNTSILVSGNQIVSIFPQSQNITLPPGTEIIPSQGKIISPGFIDTHRHLWQSAFRTLGSNTSLAEYFDRYSEFTQAQTVFTPDDVYYGQLIGIYESLNAGVTSILDHAHHTWSNATALAGLNASITSGARVWWCYAFHNLTNGYTREDQLADFEYISQYGPWRNSSTTTLGLAYDPLSLDPPSLVQTVVDVANTTIERTVANMNLVVNSPEIANSYGILNTSIPVVFSHGSYLTVQDAELLRSTNQYLSITPESEMHYGHGHASSQLIQDQAALGVDTHFTYSTDIVTQARIWLQSVRLIFYDQVRANWQIPRNNPMSVNQAFLLATRAGGLALRRPDIGVLVEGAKADLVVFDGAAPNLIGWVDPVAAVMLHSNVGNVQHVMVDGVFKKRDFNLTLGADYSEVQQQFLQSARRIQGIWEATPLPDLEGDYPFSSGVLYGQAVTADVIRGNGTGY
ncbi:putative chlorohydrolase family protein [Glonium stellatum]|uniref:Putative chlorohydrolase family protein n=1 Tax=Glonium stellatum TaxID=574774 RepID=A0A8E2F3J0_9PEZI|nr:putative chlorohydrolase family protein [Glonium stellatum]